ncbi:DUF167 domain-containing protein [Patescibacteria group bacterium]|nr:DUF167 domain-containing protein [Patescibacteria group bacterium]
MRAVAEHFGVPVRNVKLIAGETSREKIIEIL